MKYSLIVLLFLPMVSQAQLMDYSCPIDGQQRNIKEMYDAMKPGLIYGMEDSAIVFVDEADELKDSTGSLTQIGESYLNAKTGAVDIRGTFKIGYDYNAKECRRQVVLQKEVAPGVYSGSTSIEICNPGIKRLIESVKAKDFATVFVAIKAQADSLIQQYEAIQTALNADHSICDQKDKATYDRTKCSEERQKSYALSSSASSLMDLEITKENSKYVHYLTDKNGIIIPRFAVTGIEYFFRREKQTKYSRSSGKESKVHGCAFHATHAVSYAGLATSYNWLFSYNKSTAATTWTYDASNQSVLGKSYSKDINSINFLDKNQYFYIGF